MNEKTIKIGIIGTGSWGLALATILSKKHKVALFFNSEKNFFEISDQRISSFLPGIKISKKILLTRNLKALILSDILFIVVPAQRFRENLIEMKNCDFVPKNLVLCSKGIEIGTNLLMSEISSEFFPYADTMVLSGPNFAREVASGLPTAFVLSGNNRKKIKDIGGIISDKFFRPYFNSDLIGTQLGGALKNIIAIACGIVIGKKLGENARSSVMTRGLQESVSLGIKMGAKKQTFYGLSGIGDFNLSCGSKLSRNFNFGFQLGKGTKISLLKKEKRLVEGILCCESVNKLAEVYGVEMPISRSIGDISAGKSISSIIKNLLSRPYQFEN